MWVLVCVRHVLYTLTRRHIDKNRTLHPHPCRHAKNACTHTYIDTYIQTRIHTCIHISYNSNDDVEEHNRVDENVAHEEKCNGSVGFGDRTVSFSFPCPSTANRVLEIPDAHESPDKIWNLRQISVTKCTSQILASFWQRFLHEFPLYIHLAPIPQI